MPHRHSSRGPRRPSRAWEDRMTPLFPSGPERVFPSQESGDFRRFRASESSSRRDPGSPGLQQTSFPSLGRPWPPARSADGTRPWRGEQRPKSKEEPSSGRPWPLGVQGPLPLGRLPVGPPVMSLAHHPWGLLARRGLYSRAGGAQKLATQARCTVRSRGKDWE